MPKFFVPFPTAPEMAENTYAEFEKNSLGYEIVKPGRLFTVSFRHNRELCTAEVGKEIKRWPERAGKVLAIIETERLVLIHTVDRNCDGAIMVSPQEISERIYFDDYPSAK